MVTRVFTKPVPVLKLAPSLSPPRVAGQAFRPRGDGWPTRASLIEMFGSDEVVSRVLVSLMNEAREDDVLLDQARLSANALLVMERLHRLVGSLAFVGMADLERCGEQLIARVQAAGVEENTLELQAFQRKLRVYITYLSRL